MHTYVPFGCTVVSRPIPLSISTARRPGQNGWANSTCTARASKNVLPGRRVLSITWSEITRSRGAIASWRLPVAPLARMCVTPSFFRAKMFARYGTRDGLKRWPGPWRARIATRWPPTSDRRIGPDGLPNGVSTSTRSPCAPSVNASPMPVPPMSPTSVWLTHGLLSLAKLSPYATRRRRGGQGIARCCKKTGSAGRSGPALPSSHPSIGGRKSLSARRYLVSSHKPLSACFRRVPVTAFRHRRARLCEPGAGGGLPISSSLPSVDEDH